jgi:DNA (cytosine-5)-methyltransferase 1
MKTVDLFCGCGGLSLGFEQAGFEILAGLDNWKPAIDVYKANFHHSVIEQDLRNEHETIKVIQKFSPEIIIGGTPCQDFSSAGKLDTNGGKAVLTKHFANVICEIKPKWFVMENVERIIKNEIYHDIRKQFLNNGYGLTAVTLNASLCGVPQKRSRFFLIGELDGKQDALLELVQIRLSKKMMTVRDYFGEKLNLQYYYRHPRSYARRGIFSIDEPSPTIRGVNRPMPPNYKLHSGDPQNIDLETVRPLTTLERSYLQTFPESFNFFGTKTNLEQMIGNSVPVNMAKFVALTITEYVCKKNSN